MFYIFSKEFNKKRFITSCDNISTAIRIVNEVCNFNYDTLGYCYITIGNLDNFDLISDVHSEENSIFTKNFYGEIVVNTTQDFFI